MFEIKPGRYFIGFWYFDIPVSTPEFPQIGPFGKGGNFNCLVWREGDNGGGSRVTWQIQFRFLYYRDERIIDHQDQMSWSAGELKDLTEEEAEDSVSKWVTQCAMAAKEFYEFWPIRGDNMAYWQRARQAPPRWMHHDPKAAEKIEKLHAEKV